MYVTLTASGVSKKEIISTPISIPGWETECCVTHRSILPTEAWQHFSLSRSVLSIIHGICLLFFFDRAQHNTFPPRIQVCQSNEGAMSFSNCSVAPVISHRECHCYISFEFYKHCSAWALSRKCVY